MSYRGLLVSFLFLTALISIFMEKLLSEQLDYVTWKQQEKSMLFLCGKKDLILSPNKTWWVRVQCLWTGRPTAFWNEREHSESDSNRVHSETTRRLWGSTLCGTMWQKGLTQISNGLPDWCLLCVKNRPTLCKTMWPRFKCASPGCNCVCCF